MQPSGRRNIFKKKVEPRVENFETIDEKTDCGEASELASKIEFEIPFVVEVAKSEIAFEVAVQEEEDRPIESTEPEEVMESLVHEETYGRLGFILFRGEIARNCR